MDLLPSSKSKINNPPTLLRIPTLNSTGVTKAPRLLKVVLPGYDVVSNKQSRCVICMCDFALGEEVRFLPCMHIYHKECIDDWLLRSFTCPSCVEPVDAALLSTYFTNEED